MSTSCLNEYDISNKIEKKEGHFLTVTDGVMEECVDSGGNRAILNVGESRGPGPPGGEENGQLASDSGGG